ncbi:hypothetical protein P8452_76938 [Trifolium repens]|nr:hypothetical protein P8452_76938 [Trifolium repens]
MSHNDQNQPQAVAYDDQTSKDTLVGPYLVSSPAIINKGYSQNVPPKREIKFKGSGFWRGCCAGWCCFCCLDICF